MKAKQLESLRKKIVYMLMAVIFFVPLIVSLKIRPVPSSLQGIYTQEVNMDFFAYGKMQVLVIGTVITLILTGVYQMYGYTKAQWKEKRIIFILLGSFAISVFISFLLARQKDIAWTGTIDRYEGTLTWLSYIALTYCVISIIKSQEESDSLIAAFVLSSTVVSLIGVFQMIGMDFFKTSLGKLLMLGRRYEELFMSISFNFGEGRVYTTLYNPNYVGSLVALSIPLTVYLLFYMSVTKRKWLVRIGLSVSLGLQFMALIGSKSTGGIVAVLIAFILMGIYALIQYRSNIKVWLGVLAFFILILGGVTQVSVFESYYSKIVRSLNPDPDRLFTSEFVEVEYQHPNIIYTLQNGEKLGIVPIDGGLDVEAEGVGEAVDDQANERLLYKITSEDYYKQVMFYYNTGLVRVYVKNLSTEKLSESRFNYYNTGQFYVGALALNELNYNATSIEWFENERFMSQRGYIWNRTIPMVLEQPLFGYGADTFSANYAQGDLMYKYGIFRNHTIIVDKPHNFFLNISINFGLIGLGLFLASVAYVLISSGFTFLSIGVITYFIVGIINDSVIFGTYMLFVIMGLLYQEKIKGRL